MLSKADEASTICRSTIIDLKKSENSKFERKKFPKSQAEESTSSHCSAVMLWNSSATNTTFYSGPQTRSNQRFNNLWCSRLCQQGAQTMVVLWTPSRDTWSTMYSLPWRYSCSKTAAPCTAEQNDKTQGAKQKITRNNKRLQHSNQPTCPQTLSRTISRSLATILPTTQASLNIPNLRATLPL